VAKRSIKLIYEQLLDSLREEYYVNVGDPLLSELYFRNVINLLYFRPFKIPSYLSYDYLTDLTPPNMYMAYFTMLPELYLLFVIFFLIIFNKYLKNNVIIILFFYLILLLQNYLYIYIDNIYNYETEVFLKNNYSYITSIVLTFLMILISCVKKYKSFEQQVLYLFLIFFSVLLQISANFLSLYICLEIVSFILFLLINIESIRVIQLESTIKYFIITTISTILILLSFLILQYLVGSLNFFDIYLYYKLYFIEFRIYKNIFLIPVLLFLFGLFLKLGLFPGHS
jgi:NADH:ubiquinone oxidoreductase subunit 2 (subunit N)